MKKKSTLKVLIAGAVLALGFMVYSPSTLAAKNFTDLGSSKSHAVAVQHLNKLNAFDYKTGTKLNGEAGVTRAEASAVLHAMYSKDFKVTRKYSNSFKDVSSKTANFKAIAWSYEVGIFDGDNNGKFSPNDKLTRAQMSKILVNAFGLKTDKVVKFNDVKANNWAYSYVTALASNGITVGNGKGSYLPNDNVTLNQLSSFIYRIIQKDKVTVAPKPTPPPVVEKPTPKPPVVEVVPPTEEEYPQDKVWTVEEMEAEVVRLTNIERVNAGLTPLKIDTRLMLTAREKSDDLGVNEYFSHHSPTYGDVKSHAQKNGVTARAIGENLVGNAHTPENAVQRWMNSPGHRANMLRPEFTHIGVGAWSSEGYTIVTQIFSGGE